MKQRHREDPYKEGTFTTNITSFSKERSYFFKIHGTSPSLKDQERPTSPLLSCLGQCFFLVFEEIRYLLIDNVSLSFDDMCLHKEEETFLNICMGYSKWGILKMLPIWELIKDRFPFHPNGKFLNIGVEEFWIIEHRLLIWIENFCNLLLLLSLICSTPFCWYKKN